MIFNRTLKGFLRKEFLQALRDPRMRVLLFVAPVLQLTLFGVAISNEVKNIRLAAVYAPSDTRARDIHERAIATGWFVRPSRLEGEDPFEWLRMSEVDAVLIAPKGGLTRALERGEGRLQLLVDAKNVVRAQAVENYVRGVLRESMASAAARSGLPLPMGPAPIDVDIRVLYNPTLKTSYFMVPGVMGMLLSVITIILTSMSIAREREAGTLETLISAPVERWEVILGKSIPFAILGIIQLVIVMLTAIFGFGVPFRGPLVLVALSGIVYVCCSVSIGVLISTTARSQQQAMLGGFLFLWPAVLFSGLMFPLENMPYSLQWIAYVNPVAHFIALMRNLLLKGGDASFVAFHVGCLAFISVSLVILSFRRFRTSL